MKSVYYRSVINFILLVFLFLYTPNLFSQIDSINYWHNQLLKSNTLEKAVKTEEAFQSYFARKKGPLILSDAELILTAAAKCDYPRRVFFELFYCFEGKYKNTLLENEFTQFAINLEHNKEFANEDVQNQLYYYYTLLYYKLSEYYYSEKYAALYLKNGANSFPEKVQENFYLNAMTISALIDKEKNNLPAALKKFNNTLDSSISKNNFAWIGITKGNIGDIYFQQGNYDEAINYLKEDCRLSVLHNELGSAMGSFLTLKDIYFKQNKIDLSDKYLDSAYQIYTKLLVENPNNELNYLSDGLVINNLLAEKYNNKRDYVNASKFFLKAYELNKLKSQEERTRRLKKIIQGIEIDKNINQINELNKEINRKEDFLTISMIIITAVIGMLIAFMVFYRHLKSINKKLIENKVIIEQQNIVLEKTNRDKDLLFTIVSHDLRGPANSLHLIIKAVVEKNMPASVLESLLPSILLNSSNLVNTLESLLAWSTTQLKGIEIKKEVLDINEYILRNIDFFEDLACNKSIKLINNCTSILASIDKNHLEIILRNLTSNAIKFSKKGGNIIFSQTEFAKYIEISITDEGIGLNEEQLNNIMNSKALKSGVGTSGEKGIGLGLILTREFIEINGGNFKVKSQLNMGTTMSFTILK